MKDELTGLLTRDAFRLLVEHELLVARRTQRVDTLLVIDVEHLDSVNESHGRDGGDETLRAIGRLLNRTARESDIFGRIGGDECAIFALDCSGDALAKRISQTVASAGETATATSGSPLSVQVKIGITQVRLGESFDDLIERAGPAAFASTKQR